MALGWDCVGWENGWEKYCYCVRMTPGGNLCPVERLWEKIVHYNDLLERIRKITLGHTIVLPKAVVLANIE